MKPGGKDQQLLLKLEREDDIIPDTRTGHRPSLLIPVRTMGTTWKEQLKLPTTAIRVISPCREDVRETLRPYMRSSYECLGNGVFLNGARREVA